MSSDRSLRRRSGRLRSRARRQRLRSRFSPADARTDLGATHSRCVPATGRPGRGAPRGRAAHAAGLCSGSSRPAQAGRSFEGKGVARVGVLCIRRCPMATLVPRATRGRGGRGGRRRRRVERRCARAERRRAGSSARGVRRGSVASSGSGVCAPRRRRRRLSSRRPRPAVAQPATVRVLKAPARSGRRRASPVQPRAARRTGALPPRRAPRRRPRRASRQSRPS
jgi:hypothetical protein